MSPWIHKIKKMLIKPISTGIQFDQHLLQHFAFEKPVLVVDKGLK